MMKQTQLKKVQELFDLGAHLGHKKSRLNPKARKNVYTILNGTSIIDLTKTAEQLEEARTFLKNAAKEGKTMLLVGTKKVASTFLKEYAEKNKIPYITNKWLPGLLTNFEMIMKNVEKLLNMKQQRDTGELEKLVKHERTHIRKEITKLERLYGGIENLKNKPDIVVIVDPKKEKNALKEAKAFDIPVVSLVDTNADPEDIDYPVVANDDDAKVVEHIMTTVLDAYTQTKPESSKSDSDKKTEKTKSDESEKKEPAVAQS